MQDFYKLASLKEFYIMENYPGVEVKVVPNGIRKSKEICHAFSSFGAL